MNLAVGFRGPRQVPAHAGCRGMAGRLDPGALRQSSSWNAASLAKRSRSGGLSSGQRMGLKEVNGIDVAGEFPYEAVAAFAKAHGQEGLLAGSYRSVTSEEDAAFVGERLRTVTNVRNNLPSIGRMLVAGLTQSST